MVAIMEEEDESQSFANSQKLTVQKPTIYERIWWEGNKVATFSFIAFSIIAAVACVLKELNSTPSEPQKSDEPIPTLSVGSEIGTLTLDELHQTLFSLVIILILAIAAGYLVELVKLPALLGMLITGIILKNCPPFDSKIGFPDKISTIIRSFAFLIILLRAGLGLDSKALLKLKGACLRLAFLPCSAEAIVVGIAAWLIFDMKIIFGFLLGFILAAVSPAVIVPQMIELQHEKLGTDKGIPTLVTAAASIDDVYAITWFSLCLTFIDSESTNTSFIWTIIKAPLEVLVGIFFGTILGLILWIFPDQQLANLTFRRLSLLISASCAILYGSNYFGVETIGPIAILVSGFVAALRWRKLEHKGITDEDNALKNIWDYLAQPFLFALIGFQLNLSQLDNNSILQALGVLVAGILIRIIVAILALFGTQLNWKEKIFTSISWIPKATVQAALAPVLLDLTRNHPDKFSIFRPEALTILTVSVLAILITAPIGAILIRFLAPILLKKGKLSEDEDSGVELKTVEDGCQ